MPYAADGNFTVSTFDDVMRMYFEIYVNQYGYSGTFEEFKQGKYGALHYGSAQLYIRAEIETSMILEKAKDFYREQNALIETNNLNPQGIRDAFKEKLGYEVALDSSSAGFGIAIDYEPSVQENMKIAQLLATECYAYDDLSMMKGDISQAYQGNSSSQSFVMKWKRKQDKTIKFAIVITHVADVPAPILTRDEVLSKFVQLWGERYVWGNTIQPQRIMNENDIAFAASVQVMHDGGTGGSITNTSPLSLPYYEKAAPEITVNEIQITQV